MSKGQTYKRYNAPDPIRIFLGYDQAEAVAYHTFCHSIWRRSSQPVEITPIMRGQLADLGVHNREWDPLQSNEFAFTRWLVPLLCQYQGWALFFDCDMLMLDDVAKLWHLRDYTKDVMVVQHTHDATKEPPTKYLDRPQTPYARKNWSSVMMFNCERCRALTPSYVNEAHGLELHQFEWTDTSLIGELPPQWNHLVGVHPPMPGAANVHFTLGGPYFQGYEDCEFADAWREEYLDMVHCAQLPLEAKREKAAVV